ncbi:hypothetical protein C8J56DRAFT_1161048 [Mycena floridula]|nr:hypothetical protein C8J56DRAFT_1161048 [Mycena floridula]
MSSSAVAASASVEFIKVDPVSSSRFRPAKANSVTLPPQGHCVSPPTLLPSPSSSEYFGVRVPIPFHSLTSRSFFVKWIIICYCTLSVIFMPLALYQNKYPWSDLKDLQRIRKVIYPQSSVRIVPSLIKQTSAKLSSFHSLKDFELFVVRGGISADENEIAACIWTESFNDATELASWAAHWPGPISLVVSTHNLADRSLLNQNYNFIKYHPSLSKVSLHIATSESPQQSPNTFLNLARLFSPSPLVALFPANLSVLPPVDLYSSLSSIQSLSERPVIVNNMSRLLFPPPALSPVVLQRHYPVWCTERAFFFNSRAPDWNDCIWQLWLEEFGQLGHLSMPIPAAPQKEFSAVPVHVVRRPSIS